MARDLQQIAHALHPSGELRDAQDLGGGISYLTRRATLHVQREHPVAVIIREAGPAKLEMHPQHLGEEYALLEYLAVHNPVAVRTP